MAISLGDYIRPGKLLDSFVNDVRVFLSHGCVQQPIPDPREFHGPDNTYSDARRADSPSRTKTTATKVRGLGAKRAVDECVGSTH